jgi:glucosamine-6-phosphate deaminase
MRLDIVDDYEALSASAARFIADEIARLAAPVVLAATGSTPVGAYTLLGSRYAAGELDTSSLTVVQLDEYAGIGADDWRSLFAWTERAVVGPLGVPLARVVRFEDAGADPAASCRAYAASVRTLGGIDLAVLGLGPNGHLGFNEPPAGPSATTRVVPLSAASIASNAHYWGSRSHVPEHALTAGMDIILAARKILLLVSGAHKADVLRRTLEEEISDDLPATHLRGAPDVTVIADRAAWPAATAAGLLDGSRAVAPREDVGSSR